jgi:hypothetical protein
LVVDKIVELIEANKKFIGNLRKLEVSNENGSGGRKSVLQPHEALQAFPELP